MLDLEADYAATHDDLAASVFLTAGEEEDLLEGFNMCGNVVDMAERLQGRGYPGLDVAHVILPAESHSSTIGAAVSRGIRHLFAE